MNLDNISIVKEEFTGTWVTSYLFIRIRHFQMCRGYYLPTQKKAYKWVCFAKWASIGMMSI